MVAYEYNGYWKDVGTLSSYWEANMELIDIIPEFNLYEEFWKIYTSGDILPPQYISEAVLRLSDASSEMATEICGRGVEFRYRCRGCDRKRCGSKGFDHYERHRDRRKCSSGKGDYCREY